MSTNHNRIKVADLETNQPNKILKTNLNGELEFSDANNLQTENYNALDCTSEGKTLDARQGKVLKDMIDNSSVNLATDPETQITAAVTEDNKVVSRSKLFNWWQWVKSQSQSITGVWNFSKGLKTEILRDGYTWISQMTNYSFFVSENTPYHYSEIEISANGIRQKQDKMQSFISFGTITQDNLVNIPNQSGTLALKNDFVKTAIGTTETPSLIIPNGKLTTVPQNGAIERDENGQLWETHNGVRQKLLNTLDASSFVAKENLPTDIINDTLTATIPNRSLLDLLYPDVPVGTYIHFTKLQNDPNFPATYRKTTFGWIMFGFTQIKL